MQPPFTGHDARSQGRGPDKINPGREAVSAAPQVGPAFLGDWQILGSIVSRLIGVVNAPH